jgi:hypothetical protein
VDAELAKLKEVVQRGDVERLRTLLSQITLPVLSQAVDEYGRQSLLMLAIEGRWTEAALLLIEKGAPVDWKGRGQRALHEASMAGDVEVASVLLDKGAAVGNGSGEGITPFILGCAYNHAGIVELLLKSKHFTPSMWRNDRDDAVVHAMCRDDPFVLQSVLRHGPGILEHQGSFWASLSGQMLATDLDMEGQNGPMACYRRVRKQSSSTM